MEIHVVYFLKKSEAGDDDAPTVKSTGPVHLFTVYTQIIEPIDTRQTYHPS